VIEPLKFDQKLLICNAYPHKQAAVVSKNGGEKVIAEHGLKFNQCEYSKSQILPHDKLDFSIADVGIEGTFEVGALPESDAVLLLVLERRDDKSSMVSFQSFAFPTNRDSDDAQLAVIDTFKGASKMAHLKIADIAKEAGKESVERMEELNFNRVYAVEEGEYDASVEDRLDLGKDAKKLETETQHKLKLKKGQDYVVLRTGDDKEFPQSLVAFPNMDHSGAAGKSFVAGLVALALAMVFAQ